MFNPKKLFAIFFVPLALAGFFAFSGEANQPKTAAKPAKDSPSSAAPVFVRAVNFAESDPVRDLAAQHPATDQTKSPRALQAEGTEKNELNRARVKRATAASSKIPSLDSALPGKPISSNPPSGPLLSFDGISDADNAALIGGAVAPSDDNVAVGPNHVVEVVNDGFRVWDKAGNPLIAPTLISSVFTKIGGICANTNDGDPVVLHDRMADRWILSQFAFTSSTTPPYHECVAISKSSDPTGEYYAYDFVTVGNEFPDYPKLGTWPDGYYMTVNQFTNGGSFNGVGAYAFDRQKMLVGDPSAGEIYFDLDLTSHPEGIYAMQPSDFDGFTLPPSGAPNVFAYEISDEFESAPYNVDALRLFNFHADFATPTNSTFAERAESPVHVSAYDPRYPDYNYNNRGRADIKQPPPAASPSKTNSAAPGDYLDAIGYHLMYRLQYRNLGGTEFLTSGTTVNVSGVDPTNDVANYQAGVRYFELTKTSPSGPYAVYDNATFSPDAGNPTTGLNRWLPSAAIDGQNNLAVSYSTSSTSVFPSIAYAGRDNTSFGGLTGEQTMFAGTAVQLGSGNRWGDYQSLQVDPSDDCTFWTVNQYYNTNSSFNWRTRIGKFNFPTCTAPAQGTLSGTITYCDSGAPVYGAVVQISNGFSGATLPNGTYSIALPPGSYTATVVDPLAKCTSSGPFNFTITNGATTTLNQCLSGATDFAFSSAAVSGGNGNGVIDAFECNNLNVTLLNDGCAIGQNVSAVLSSNTPGVTITQPNSTYPSTAAGTTSTNATPFMVSTSNVFACGTMINFTLTVNYTGGSNTITFSLPTCATAPTTITGSLTSTDPTQTGRLGRTGVASSCAVPKACPGPLTATAHHYDVYNVTNGGVAECATIATTTSCNQTTNPILTKAYLGSYDPNNECTNYLGDAGGSSTSTSFSVTVPANATLVVVVEESGNGGAGCSSYTVTVSGLSGNVFGPGSCGAPSVNSVKTHGSAGTYAIAMPLLGPSGVEDRVGDSGVAGNHTIVFSYPANPAGTTATISGTNPSGGSGSISSITYNGNDMIVSLTGVSNAQVLSLATSGGPFGTITAPIGFLLGDTNADRTVNSGDVSQTKGQSGATVGSANFREDVTVDGNINSADVSSVKSHSGTSLP